MPVQTFSAFATLVVLSGSTRLLSLTTEDQLWLTKDIAYRCIAGHCGQSIVVNENSFAGPSEPSTAASVTVVSPSLTTTAPTSTTVSVSGGKSIEEENKKKTFTYRLD